MSSVKVKAAGSWRQQQGVALVTAILMVALATIAAVAMATRQQLDIRRTGNLLHGTQALAYAEGAETWAQIFLERDAKDSTIDFLEEDWHKLVSLPTDDGGHIQGRLFDMQGRFNINNLIDADGNRIPDMVDRFKVLLRNLEISDVLADNLVDFIDTDDLLGFPNGAEDNDYLLLQPGYRTANQPLASVSELYLVMGFTADIVKKLRPFITALPEPTPININTAPAEVLRALATTAGGSPGISQADAENIVSAREGNEFEKVTDFMALPVVAASAGAIDPSMLSVKSNWFQLRAVADIGQAHTEMTSLIQRVRSKASVIMRERLLYEPLEEPVSN